MAQPSHKLFLSYAWADDPDFVRKLYGDLIASGFAVWWDQADLVSRGTPIRQELNESIRQAERLIPIIGPAALVSKNVQLEWQYARNNCMVITPIIRQGEPTIIPDDWRGAQGSLYFDFRDDAKYEQVLAQFMRSLEYPISPLGQYLTIVPDLPKQYVPRKDEMEALHRLVLADIVEAVAITSARRTTTLHGMGGIGKSVVAAAFVHDCLVRRRFGDGILWLTVGREPNVRDLLAKAGSALGDHNPERYRNEVQACESLHETAIGRTALLILDDVWNGKHAKPFREAFAGTSCQMLVTTRLQDVTTALDAQEHKVGLFDEDEAVALIEQWTGKHDPGYALVARKLDYLPLAIRLAGALMAEGYSPQEWLNTFDRISRIALDIPSPERNESLDTSIGLSVQSAFPGAEADRVLLYHSLGVFHEDVRIPQETVIRLWKQLRPDLDEFTLIRTVDRLVRLALVERAEDKTITLHDLLHSYNVEKLGDRLISANEDLLAAWNPDRRPWHTLPDDGYLYHHLAYHLRESGRRQELHDLLTDSPAWMDAKYSATGADASYANDLDFAIKDLTDPLSPEQLLSLFCLVAAQLLIKARVGAWDDRHLKTLALIGQRDRALVLARMRSDLVRRCYSLLAIVEVSDRADQLDLLGEIVDIAKTIDYSPLTAYGVICNTASALAGFGQDAQARNLLNELITIAQSIPYPEKRSDALSCLAAILAAAGELNQAVELARLVSEPYERFGALRNVISGLLLARESKQAERVLKEAISITKALGKGSNRTSWAWCDIAGWFAQLGQPERGIELAKKHLELSDHPHMLSSIVIGLRDADRFEDALELARTIDDAEQRTYALGALVMKSSGDGKFERALEISLMITEVAKQVEMAVQTARQMGEAALIEEAGTALKKAVDLTQQGLLVEERVDLWCKIAEVQIEQGRKSEAVYLLESALTAARDVAKVEVRAELQLNIISNMEKAGESAKAHKLLDETMELVETISDSWDLIRIGSALLEMGHTEAAINVARREGSLDSTLSNLALDRARAGQAEEALRLLGQAQRAAMAKSEVFHDSTLQVIVRHLAEEGLIESALDLARQISEDSARHEVTVDIVRILSKSSRIEEAINLAQAMESKSTRESALVQIAENASNAADVNLLLDLAPSITTENGRDSVLQSAAATLASSGDDSRALEVLAQIKSEEKRDSAKEDVAKALVQIGQVEPALGLARSVAEPYARLRAFREICEALVECGDLEQALAIAHGEPDSDHRSLLLKDIVTTLANNGSVNQALALTKQMADPFDLALVLSNISSAAIRSGSLDHVLNIAKTIRSRDDRDRAVAGIVGALIEADQTERAYELARTIRNTEQRSLTLGSLAVHFVETGNVKEAHEIARNLDAQASLELELMIAIKLVEQDQIDNARKILAEILSKLPTNTDEVGGSDILEGLIKFLAESDEFELALEVARSVEIDYTARRSYYVTLVAWTLLESGHQTGVAEILEEAAATLRGRSGWQYESTVFALSASWARLGFFHRALSLMEENFSGFLESIAKWVKPVERIQPGLFYKLIQEVLRIGA